MIQNGQLNWQVEKREINEEKRKKILKKNYWFLKYKSPFSSSYIMELSLCHKLRFFNLYISLQPNVVDLTWILLDHIIQVWNITPLSCKDIGIRKVEFVAKT